jgi:hypothetical protein
MLWKQESFFERGVDMVAGSIVASTMDITKGGGKVDDNREKREVIVFLVCFVTNVSCQM